MVFLPSATPKIFFGLKAVTIGSEYQTMSPRCACLGTAYVTGIIVNKTEKVPLSLQYATLGSGADHLLPCFSNSLISHMVSLSYSPNLLNLQLPINNQATKARDSGFVTCQSIDYNR